MSFAGVSVIANGRLQQPSAPIYPGTASSSGYHLLVVEGYSCIKHTPNGTPLESRPFRLGGYLWVLEIYPNGQDPKKTDSISMFLNLDQDVARPVRVHLDFNFIDQVEEQAPTCIRAIEACDFSSSDRSWGQSSFIRREALEQSKHLQDDCFTIRCDLIIVDPLAPFIDVPSSNMHHHFSQLLGTEVGTDVTFMVGGETFVAHRCVLAARSTVFMAELFGPMKEGSKDIVIQIQEMEPSVFKALLRFIYTDSLPKMEVSSSMKVEGEVERSRAEAIWLQDLLVAADRYDLQRLKSMCEEQLAKHIDLSSVTTVLALAAQRHCSGLQEACLGFLTVQSATALQGVMKTSDWEHIAKTYTCVLNELIAKLASKV
ncbi:unnamed protein product [Alopecurus aequalis]